MLGIVAIIVAVVHGTDETISADDTGITIRAPGYRGDQDFSAYLR